MGDSTVWLKPNSSFFIGKGDTLRGKKGLVVSDKGLDLVEFRIGGGGG